MKGSGKELGELPPVECTYSDCGKHFAMEKEMKKHKVVDPAHDYCKKCDVDCADWEALVQHKIDAMSPWLEGKMTEYVKNAPRDEIGEVKIPSPKHIVCEFCGIDFRSFGGRKMHRSQDHPADQSITCPGCGAYFVRAATMIEHIEEGHCTVISRREFLGNVHHMHFRAEIMKAPDVFRANLEVNKIIPLELNLTSQPRPRHVHVANSDDDQSSMSVLLDQDDPSQMAGHKPIIPGKPDPVLMSFEGSDASISGGVSVTYDRVESETWPRLPSRPQSNITKGVRSMSIASNAPSVCGTEVSETNFSATTSRRAGLMVVPESYSSLRSANTDDSDSVASSYATVTKAINNENVWSTHSISPKLSKQKIQAVPKAKAGDWTTITREGQEHWQDDKKDDLLHSRWWDSTSADYNMERFIAYVEIPRYDSRTGKMMINPETQEPVIESIVPKYCCPFPGCEFAKFDTPQEFETHWAYGHQIQCRCPCCLKVFKSAASLVRHCESNSKCAVKYSDRFEQLINDMTGGFLTTRRRAEPEIFRQEKALVVANNPIYGLMPIEYSARMHG